MKLYSFTEVCRPNSGASTFFTSILIWGVGMGCFAASFNNFIINLYDISATQRGWFEFLREMPGVMLIIILAALHRYTDWTVLRLGTLISMAAAFLLLIPAPWAGVVCMITLWSLGEHVVMPMRQSIALSLAREGRSGESLGIVTSATNVGTMAGSLVVAAVFFTGTHALKITNARVLYDVVWCIIIALLALSVAITLRQEAPGVQRRRPSFYFRRKYMKFYMLELFYGARKQVFLTFAPFVLIRNYGMATGEIALLFGFSAFITALWGGRLIGRITDRWGYRNVMVWDTVILFFVCLLYGFADKMFPPRAALAVVCVNYVLDALISNASIATNLYARMLSDSQAELTATLSSGISVNHLISVCYVVAGGIVFDQFGAGVLFAFAALMALANSAFAMTVPDPRRRGAGL